MVIATIKSLAERPELHDAVVVTLRYHIPRCEAFLKVCGMGEDGQIQDWIFENFRLKTGKDLLTPEFRQMVNGLHERGVRIKTIGAEDILDQVDQNRLSAGAQPRYGSVLRLIYPPKLSKQQFESMDPTDQQDWLDRVNNLKERLNTEARGVSQMEDHTYWQPKN
jgi:hypothetical protein